MTACGTDYLTENVAAHEKGMREQAKKMGVKSLRSEEAQKTSAECRLCKVALMTVSLWFVAWTPYFVISWGGMFNRTMVTPLFSIWGFVFAKANAVYNPIVYTISHPRYRAALEKKLPCLSCATEGKDSGGSDAGSTTTAEMTVSGLGKSSYTFILKSCRVSPEHSYLSGVPTQQSLK
ncbi:rhodopsin-like [Penaeus monodon]|uniref:rhodopsin-like n=1 Tax=Penaeus monodon TaxID=6687 RepID=UPI0018A747A6|nr:rhodopsin-like [Penaeus monodon]XP_037786270.1 rhodopsin-like [Penaeus monodon]